MAQATSSGRSITGRLGYPTVCGLPCCRERDDRRSMGTGFGWISQPDSLRNSDRSQLEAQLLHALRKFLIDVEVWGWVKLRIRPHHHLATPRTVSFASRVNPRVIDDAAWLKLIWASLNIERADLLSEIHYPLAMIQAMAVVWTHAGLRQNEIKRLVVGCARGQQEDILNDDGSRVPSGTLC